MAIEVMRMLMTSASSRDVKRLDVEVSQRVADFLINRKRRDITQLEEQYDVIVNILTGTNVGPEHLKITCRNAIGAEVNVPLPAKATR